MRDNTIVVSGNAMRQRLSVLLLLTVMICHAQQAQTERPRLEYNGKPIKVTGQCKAEDVLTLGLSCSSEDPCPLFLELSDIELVGTRLFVSGNLHTNSATFESILLTSDDLGKTWTEPTARVAASGLEDIQFIDFESGWIAGQTLLGLPRDPFLLITSDGGKTWRKRPIYGEPRVGAIERFRFDSRTTGSLVLDKIQSGETGMRHELYETQTGGESWMLRQVGSKPIPLREAKPLTSEWRVRADGPTKSYKIERRSGNAWQTAASFLVAAGECKPAEPDVSSPAPPPEDAEQPAPKPQAPPTLKKKP